MAWDKDIGDEPEPALRDRAPDILTPIDADAPVSGHHPPADTGRPVTEAPEHDWAAAASRLLPLLRPSGASGTSLSSLDRTKLAVEGMKSHAQPVIDPGPAGLTIAYALLAGSFDVLVNADHLLGWAVEPDQVRGAAMQNLGLWSSVAPWTDELSGQRRLLSSDTGEGADAARILLPEVRQHLAEQLGQGSRVLVGLPERHLLVAGSLAPDDMEFAALFGEFVREAAEGADEPIDRRVFELVGGELALFEG
jgi:hypothetical protein